MTERDEDQRATSNLINAEAAGLVGATVAAVMTKDGYSLPKKAVAVGLATAFVPIMEEGIERFQDRFAHKEPARSFAERAEESLSSERSR